MCWPQSPRSSRSCLQRDRVRRATSPRSMMQTTQALCESHRLLWHTRPSGLRSRKHKRRNNHGWTSGGGCGWVWFYSTVNDDTTPSPIRRLPKLATNCMIVRNSPWSAKAGRVVLGHLHTNYPDAKSGPDPSGQRARPGRQVMHTVGLTHSNSQIPARPDVHTVRRHRFSGVRRAARRAHSVAAAILEGRPDRGRHQGPILKKDHRFTTEPGERGNSKHGSARPTARAPSNASSGMPWTACCPNRSATFWSVRRSSGLGSPRSSTSSTSGLRCEHGRDS